MTPIHQNPQASKAPSIGKQTTMFQFCPTLHTSKQHKTITTINPNDTSKYTLSNSAPHIARTKSIQTQITNYFTTPHNSARPPIAPNPPRKPGHTQVFISSPENLFPAFQLVITTLVTPPVKLTSGQKTNSLEGPRPSRPRQTVECTLKQSSIKVFLTKNISSRPHGHFRTNHSLQRPHIPSPTLAPPKFEGHLYCTPAEQIPVSHLYINTTLTSHRHPL
jgi:hypothetical protein